MNVYCPHCGKSSDVSPEDLGNVAEYEYLEAECPYCQKNFQIATSLLLQTKPGLKQAGTSVPRQPQSQSTQLPSYLQTGIQRRRKKVSLRKIIVCTIIALVVGAISIDFVMGKVAKKKAARLRQQLIELEKNMVPIPGKAFSMCKYEVTQALWEAVMGSNPSFHKGAELPVENISLDDCLKFEYELNEWAKYMGYHGYSYMIPSKWQWETASAGGVNENAGEYGFCKLADGKIIQPDTLDAVAWYAPNSAWQTHPVGQKTPNAFGLYDMFGNVSEWIREGRKPGDREVFYFGGGYRDNAMDCYPINIVHSSRIFPSRSPSPDRGLRLSRMRHVD